MRSAETTRLAWWLCLAPLALLVLLAFARPAAALTLPASHIFDPSAAVLPSYEEEDESEEWEEEDCEEECEEEWEEEQEEDFPPEECLLQTARTRVTAYPSQNKVRLQIRYTSISPAEATVDWRLKGGKGALKLKPAKQHLAKSGTVQLTESLSKGAMGKLMAAQSFAIELRIPTTPRYCRSYDTRKLTIKHAAGSRITWLQP